MRARGTNIQHAATKVTNMLYLPEFVSFHSLTN